MALPERLTEKHISTVRKPRRPKAKVAALNKKAVKKPRGEVPVFAQNSIQSFVDKERMPRKQTHAKTQLRKVAVANDLNNRERAIAMEYLDNFLYPSRGIKLVRAIPVRSAAFYKAGELTWQSTGEWSEVRFRPDPWKLISVREESLGKTVVSNAPFRFEYQHNNGVVVNTRSIALCSYGTLRCTDNSTISSSVGIQVNINGAPPAGKGRNNQDDDQIDYWPALNANGAASFVFNNGTGRAVSVAGYTALYNDDETVSNYIGSPTVICPAGQTIVPFTMGQNSTATAGLIFGCFVTNNSGYDISVKDLAFTVETASTVFTTNSTISTKDYTLGQALYPTDAALQEQVMQIFTTSQLWSPVAMACLYNVSQELQKAGGKFTASYLPSWVEDKLDTSFSEEWSTLASYSNSYPRFQGPFKTGAQASWVGQRIDDYAFRKPYTSAEANAIEESSMPIDVFMSQRAAESATNNFYLTFAVCFEVQSLNPALTMSLGPSSTSLIPMLLAHLVASNHLVGENPDHIARLKKLALKIINDPLVRQGFKTLAGAGMVALLA